MSSDSLNVIIVHRDQVNRFLSERNDPLIGRQCHSSYQSSSATDDFIIPGWKLTTGRPNHPQIPIGAWKNGVAEIVGRVKGQFGPPARCFLGILRLRRAEVSPGPSDEGL